MMNRWNGIKSGWTALLASVLVAGCGDDSGFPGDLVGSDLNPDGSGPVVTQPDGGDGPAAARLRPDTVLVSSHHFSIFDYRKLVA